MITGLILASFRSSHISNIGARRGTLTLGLISGRGGLRGPRDVVLVPLLLKGILKEFLLHLRLLLVRFLVGLIEADFEFLLLVFWLDGWVRWR